MASRIYILSRVRKGHITNSKDASLHHSWSVEELLQLEYVRNPPPPPPYLIWFSIPNLTSNPTVSVQHPQSLKNQKPKKTGYHQVRLRSARHPRGEGMTVICFKGCETPVLPACCTNSAGENVLPWQTQMILTSDFVYLYKNPVMVFPFGPFPVVDTYGIWGREVMVFWFFWACGFGGFPISTFVSLTEQGVALPLFGKCLSLGFVASGMASSLGLVGPDWAVFDGSDFSIWIIPSKLPLLDSTGSEEALCSEWPIVSFDFQPFNWRFSGEEWLEWLLDSQVPPIPGKIKGKQNTIREKNLPIHVFR